MCDKCMELVCCAIYLFWPCLIKYIKLAVFESDTTFVDLFSHCHYLCFALFSSSFFIQSSLIPRTRSCMSSIFVRLFSMAFLYLRGHHFVPACMMHQFLTEKSEINVFTQTSFLSLELICIMVNITIFAGYYSYI